MYSLVRRNVASLSDQLVSHGASFLSGAKVCAESHRFLSGTGAHLAGASLEFL